MSQCLKATRETTPVDFLKKELKNILSKSLTGEDLEKQIDDAISSATCFEQEYYHHQYSVIMDTLENCKKENKMLRTQNKVLTEYIMIKEEREGVQCL